MDNKDKIEISLRAGMIAGRILELSRPVSKLHSKLVINDAVVQIKDLLEFLNNLKE
jgi:hypothetical protein